MNVINSLPWVVTNHITPGDLPTMLAYLAAGLAGAIVMFLVAARKRS